MSDSKPTFETEIRLRSYCNEEDDDKAKILEVLHRGN